MTLVSLNYGINLQKVEKFMKLSGNQSFAILCDVGGTNIRFATLPTPDGELTNYVSYPCRNFDSFAEALRCYAKNKQAKQLWVCAAGAIDGEYIELVNGAWPVDLRRAKQAVEFSSVAAINDVQAIAYALPLLDKTHLRNMSCNVVSNNDSIRVVVAPGSGLGVGGLIKYGDKYKALATEGGHISARAFDEVDEQIIKRLRGRYDHASVERLASGMGVVGVFQMLCQIDGVDITAADTAAVADRARQGCAYGKQAFSKFSQYLGGFCGDVALLYGAKGGIFLAGDLLDKVSDLFDEELFRVAFTAKGRFQGYLSEIPTIRIQHPFPALLGLQAWKLS